MITSTSLNSVSFLTKVIKGCDEALHYAYVNDVDTGIAHILNAKGKLSLIAIFRKGHRMEFLDGADNDVSEPVLSALREVYGYKDFS